MITKWASFSVTLLLTRVGSITQFYHRILICWILLELLTWTLFFLFFAKYSKVLMNHLFLFFIIQTSCRFVWLLRTLIGQMGRDISLPISNIFIGLSLIIKIGLFPGYVWGLNIYSSASLPVVLALSSIAKFTPLIMLIVWFVNCNMGRNAEVGLMLCLFLSYIRVIFYIWERRNLLSFVFLSGMFHLSNMILILLINLFSMFLLYFLTYILTLFSFAIIYQHYNIKNLQGYWKPINRSFLFLHLLRVVGFPPFPLFWFKMLILYKLWTGRFFIRISSYSILVVIFIYLITIFLFIIKSWMEKGIPTVGRVFVRSTLSHYFILSSPLISLIVLL